MRWFWIDRFHVFVRATRARATKHVTMSEPHLYDYQPGRPVMPRSLVIEGMAQTGGLVVSEAHGYDRRVVLAKVGRARFQREAMVGDTLRYDVEVERLDDAGALVSGASTIDGQPHGEFELFFGYIDSRVPGGDVWEPVDFLGVTRALGIYEVGVDQHGNRLEPPARLLAAEREELESARRP